jgi:hypothetical protein
MGCAANPDAAGHTRIAIRRHDATAYCLARTVIDIGIARCEQPVIPTNGCPWDMRDQSSSAVAKMRKKPFLYGGFLCRRRVSLAMRLTMNADMNASSA